MKPKAGQQIDLSILRLGIYGEGIGEWHGLTIFVDGALPGERVLAQIYEVRKTFARAKAISFLHYSEHRVSPPCPVFGRCGGCQLQHLAYPQQLAAKRQRVIDAFERIGKIFDAPVDHCVPSPYPYAYRNKIQLPLCADHTLHLGLYAFHSHEIISIEQCYIHCPLGEEAFQKTREVLRQYPEVWPFLRYVLMKTAVRTNQILIIFVTQETEEASFPLSTAAKQLMLALPQVRGVVQNLNSSPGNVILGKNYRTLTGEPFIVDHICGLSFKVSPASFFQVNPAQAENLYQKAVKLCGLEGKETLLDAYCGVGTLSLILAKQAEHVIGVESVPEAIEDARENAQRNVISNAVFHCATAEEFIRTLARIDVAILNPPRKGCDPSFLDKLTTLHPHRIVYISCDPATLARDLAFLRDKGYHIDSVTPFDMFPQTVHVETAVRLTLK